MGSMKEILNYLHSHNTLTKKEAKHILKDISAGKYNEAQTTAFISIFLMRNISVEEIKGFREALLELCLTINFGDQNTIDLCGTGGDGKDTFNISTLSSFVVAGAGYKVTKHGNYGVSSVCGSSNVLEHLGYTFTNNPDQLRKQLDKSNICFLHAPLFHPAMKYVAPIRRSLGIKTFFNMLGPLVNPSRPNHQLVGVFSLELQRIYGYLFEQDNMNYNVLYSHDGYDEISLTSDVSVHSHEGAMLFSPSDLGFDTLKQNQIFGGKTIKNAAKIFMNVLSNQSTEAQKNVVLANSAFAIKTLEPKKTYAHCVAQAKKSIESGSALKSLQNLISN